MVVDNMAYVLTTFFAHLIEMFSAVIMFFNIFNVKKTVSVTLFYGTCIFTLLSVVFLMVDNFVVNIITYLIANFILAFFFFECTAFSAVILAIVLDACVVGTEFLSMNFLTIIFDTELKDYDSTDFKYFLFGIISKLIYFLLCQLISHFTFLIRQKNTDDGKKISKTPLFLLIYPLSSVFVCGLFWKISFEHQFSKNINIVIVFACIFFLISIVATYLLYNQTAKKEAEVYSLQSELERKNIDEAYYKVLDYQNEELKTLVHDEKNHLSVIKSFSSIDEVEKYVDRIYDDLNKYSSSGKTKNKMLDLILNKYKVLCEEDNIDFYVNIRTANLSFMENTDLTTMLSNILDNAIEAAKNSNEKKIDLSINRVNGSDMLTCVNSSDVKPVSVSGVLKTTKEDKKFHGAGTKSIKRMVNKYKGEYEWDYDEEEKEFSTLIMFPANNKE